MKEQSDLFLYNHLDEIKKLCKKWFNKKHYNPIPLLEKGCEYSIGFGEKSNGKSTAIQMVGIALYVATGKQMVLIRVYDEDFKRGRCQKMFSGVPDAFVKDVTKGEWESITYRNFGWYLSRYDEEEDKTILDEKPFAFRQCILNAGSSFQFPDVEMIFFDEFISKTPNYSTEFEDFMTLLSTIIRLKNSVQIFMMGNTVNYYSTYFKNLGLTNIRNQKQGTIDIYKYGENGGKTAVEYTDTIPDKKKSNKYFAFNNPKLEMITKGKWQIDVYPHCPCKILPKDIVFTYFIKFEDDIFQCEIICKDNLAFTYIHRKTSKINNGEIIEFKNPDTDIIYQQEDDARPNYFKYINKPIYEFQNKIWWFFIANKVFYQDNEVGDTIRAYLNWCK